MSKTKKKKRPLDPVEKRKASRKQNIAYFLGTVAMVTPLALFIFLTVWLDAPNSGFLVIGGLGALIAGVGLLFLAVSSSEGRDHFNILLSLPFLGLGILLMSLSLCLTLIPSIYNLFSEEAVTYYFAQGSFLAVAGVVYISFRSSLFRQMRDQHKTKKELKEKMKGMANYWWYESLRGTYLSRWKYLLNKVYVCTYFPALLVHLIVGWWSYGAAVSVGLFCISCVCGCVMSIYSSALWAEDEFGHKFVLLAHKGKHKKWYGYSSVGSIIGSLALLSLAAASVKLVIGLF